jgi:serine/threonine protein kinase
MRRVYPSCVDALVPPRQLLEGLQFLHEERKVCHNDFKSDNVVVAKNDGAYQVQLSHGNHLGPIFNRI